MAGAAAKLEFSVMTMLAVDVLLPSASVAVTVNALSPTISVVATDQVVPVTFTAPMDAPSLSTSTVVAPSTVPVSVNSAVLTVCDGLVKVMVGSEASTPWALLGWAINSRANKVAARKRGQEAVKIPERLGFSGWFMFFRVLVFGIAVFTTDATPAKLPDVRTRCVGGGAA